MRASRLQGPNAADAPADGATAKSPTSAGTHVGYPSLRDGPLAETVSRLKLRGANSLGVLARGCGDAPSDAPTISVSEGAEEAPAAPRRIPVRQV